MSLSEIDGVVLVGAGKMGLALARGWLMAGLKPSALTLVDPKPTEPTRAFAAEAGVALVGTPPDAPARVVGAGGQAADDGGGAARAEAGFRASTPLPCPSPPAFRSAPCLTDLSTHRVVRAMPNTPAQVGAGMTGAVAAPGVSAEDLVVAEDLLAAAGRIPVVRRREEDRPGHGRVGLGSGLCVPAGRGAGGGG